MTVRFPHLSCNKSLQVEVKNRFRFFNHERLRKVTKAWERYVEWLLGRQYLDMDEFLKSGHRGVEENFTAIS